MRQQSEKSSSMTDNSSNTAQQKLSDPDTWVDRHGDVLYRYALVRLRNVTVAEDMVQDTFLAALRQRNQFAGRSDERTWLVGILKHKIIDHFRRVVREVPYDAAPDSAGDDSAAFHRDGLLAGTWKAEARPSDWSMNRLDAVERSEFRQFLDRCLHKLEARLRHAFVLREMEELQSYEICNVLHITPTNLRVMLHRGRMQLRACLEKHWLGRGTDQKGFV